MKISQLHQLFLNSTGISTDTRSLNDNNLFFALSGSNFNGNKFAENALSKGALKAVIDDPKFIRENTILVDDCLKTLQDLANFHRNHFNTTVIAITGSNGKTTTKELVTQVLEKKYKTTSTKGNLNNHIGVPLTLLTIDQDTEIAVIEMGANHQGEIKALCKIAQPNYGYITNFGKAHLEGFGGTQGVIKGKSELYDYLIDNNQHVFINEDDAIQVEKLKHYNKTIRIGSKNNADFKIKHCNNHHNASINYKDVQISSQLTGSYNSLNLAAATGIGLHFRIDIQTIKKAIESYAPTNNRSQVIKLKNNLIILDAYNANPTSMELAIKNLSVLPAQHKTLIIGDMFEVGSTSAEEHQHIVDILEDLSFDISLVCGKNFYQTQTKKVIPFLEFDDLKKYLLNRKIENSTILIKGSRGMQLERILDIWK